MNYTSLTQVYKVLAFEFVCLGRLLILNLAGTQLSHSPLNCHIVKFRISSGTSRTNYFKLQIIFDIIYFNYEFRFLTYQIEATWVLLSYSQKESWNWLCLFTLPILAMPLLTLPKLATLILIKKSVFFYFFPIKLRPVAVSGNARMIILEYSESLTPL